MESQLPVEYDSLLAALTEQPEHVRHHPLHLVLMMIDDEKGQVLGTRLEDGREFVQMRTVAGDEFEI